MNRQEAQASGGLSGTGASQSGSNQELATPLTVGLSTGEARARLEKVGANEMPDTAIRPWRAALAKFWAPVPWMLEAAILLQVVLHEYVEAAVVAGLLVFNAALGFFQEGRAQATLAALKSRLALTASVRRDDAWKVIPASELVPGDEVKLSLGGVVAADVKLVDGSVLLDQSMLTGESVPAEAGAGQQTYAGALASSDGGQDPVDAAIRAVSAKRPIAAPPKLTKLVPFDPATKLSEATAVDATGGALRVVKGAFAVVSKLADPSPSAAVEAQRLEEQGYRVLAVAVGATTLKLAGLVALSDPPRPDAAALVKELGALGVRTVIVTGDAPTTAKIIARDVGVEGDVCPPGPIPAGVRPESFAVFAGVMPEDKYHLVQAFQSAGHTVGMCGDGANDAPALRQAQMGIAVSTATDVAKSAAGIVLTKPGLEGVVAAVKEGRITFQRILTYTLNSVTKKVVQVTFLAAGLVITGQAILTPMLMVIIMITGDFLGMALTTDNVKPSPTPSVWRVGALTRAGAFMGLAELTLCVVTLVIGRFYLRLDIDTSRTLAFVVIVFGNQATTYTNRARQRMWSRAPSRWLVLSSLVDVLIASTMAMVGLAMAPLPWSVVGATLAGAMVFAFAVDFVKVPTFRRLGIA